MPRPGQGAISRPVWRVPGGPDVQFENPFRRLGRGVRWRQALEPGKCRRCHGAESEDQRGARARRPKTSEQGTDAPGRSISSADGRRSAVKQTDWHDQAEQRFLADLAKRLDAAVTAGETKSLIVVAPPRALGVLRQHYSAGVRNAVRAEIDKDYVRMPVHEIERHLAA